MALDPTLFMVGDFDSFQAAGDRVALDRTYVVAHNLSDDGLLSC